MLRLRKDLLGLRSHRSDDPRIPTSRRSLGHGVQMKYLPIAISLAISGVLLLTGCATYPDCRRSSYPGYNAMICPDKSVDRHCRKSVTHWDDGTPVDSRVIRACFRKVSPWRKGVVIVGESHQGCLPHEICHAQGLATDVCDKDYPCIGE